MGLGRTVVAASSVVVVAGLLLVQLDVAERLASSRELQLSRVAGLVESLASQQWVALAVGREDQQALADFRRTWAQANSQLAQFRVLAPTDSRLSEVVLWFESFVSDLDQELTFVKSGSMADAADFERSSVQPVLTGLTATLTAAEAAYHADAQRAATDKAIESVLTVVISTGLLVLLVWMARRSQLRVERRFRSLVQHSTDVFSIVSASGEILYESPAVESAFGFRPVDRVGTNAFAGVHPDDLPSVEARLEQVLQTNGAEASAEFRYLHSDGSWRWVAAFGKNLIRDPAIGGIAVNYRDITEQRDLEEQLRRQAFEDPLTGLANRALLRDRLEHAVERSRRSSGTGVVMFFLDLDDFKNVNDSLGHAAGDALLSLVAQRIRGSVRGVDTVARLGGDEFAVLAEDVGDTGPEELGHRLLEALAPPFVVSGEEIFVRASVGYAISAAGDDGDVLLRNADLAMYQAKAERKGGMRRYDATLHHSFVARLALDRDLRRALDHHEFVVQYQPIVALDSRRIVSLEALVRWVHPVHGWLPPDRFIPAAEESGLIIELGRWVLAEACRQMAAWHSQRAGGPPLRVSVNVSAQQLASDRVVDDVRRALDDAQLQPQCLILELTETTIMKEIESSVERLRALKDLGVLIAIDDFGTAYSSLRYLEQLPVDVLKIAKPFIDGIGKREGDSVMTRTITDLGLNLGLDMIAEGIELTEQLERLRELSCPHGQGYLFSTPLPADEVAALLSGGALVAPADAD